MSALFYDLSFIILRTSADRAAIPTQLMLIKSTIYWWVIVWQQRTSEVPTLLTKIPMSRLLRSATRALNFESSELFLKSKQIVLKRTAFPLRSAYSFRL